jgi:hypothetical protein
MQISANYFLGNRLAGQSTFECGCLPHSLAYFCPSCGEVWARIHCTAPDQETYWMVIHCPCHLHTPRGALDWSRIPGTLTSAFPTKGHLSLLDWARAVEHLPAEILRREFDLLLTHHLKELP